MLELEHFAYTGQNMISLSFNFKYYDKDARHDDIFHTDIKPCLEDLCAYVIHCASAL